MSNNHNFMLNQNVQGFLKEEVDYVVKSDYPVTGVIKNASIKRDKIFGRNTVPTTVMNYKMEVAGVTKILESSSKQLFKLMNEFALGDKVTITREGEEYDTVYTVTAAE